MKNRLLGVVAGHQHCTSKTRFTEWLFLPIILRKQQLRQNHFSDVNPLMQTEIVSDINSFKESHSLHSQRNSICICTSFWVSSVTFEICGHFLWNLAEVRKYIPVTDFEKIKSGSEECVPAFLHCKRESTMSSPLLDLWESTWDSAARTVSATGKALIGSHTLLDVREPNQETQTCWKPGIISSAAHRASCLKKSSVDAALNGVALLCRAEIYSTWRNKRGNKVLFEHVEIKSKEKWT